MRCYMETKIKQKHIQVLFYSAMAVLALAFIVTLILSFSNLNPHKKIIILDKTAQIKETPKKAAKTIESIERGTMLNVLNQKKDWYKVKDQKDRTGWINTKQTNKGAAVPGTKKSAVVTATKVPLTLKPKEQSSVVKQLKKGEKITLTTELDGWSQVAAGQVEGWIPSDSIKIKKTKIEKKDIENKVFTRQEGTILRKKAKLTSDTIDTVSFGEKLVFLEQVDDWYKILTPDKKVAYVPNWTVNFSRPDQTAPYKISPVVDKTILLDPGHGGSDSGAISRNETVYEKTITLATAKYVKKALEAVGANVVMTREDDSLVKLSEINEQENNDLIDTFISFHYDSSAEDNSASGVTTYYYHGNDQPLAEAINTELAKNLPLPNRGVAAGDFQVIRESQTTSILLELGYMNNDSDLNTFIKKSYQEEVAKSVTKGLMNYYEAH